MTIFRKIVCLSSMLICVSVFSQIMPSNYGYYNVPISASSDLPTPLFYYDFSNPSSYSGNGNEITDLSGNYNAIASTNTQYLEYSATESAWHFKGIEISGHGLFIQDLNYVSGTSDAISNLTISCMLKASSQTGDQAIIISYDRSAVFRFALGGDTGSPQANPGKPSFMFMTGGGSGNVNDLNFTNSPDLRDDLWHHLVLTFEANTANSLKLYIDGVISDTIATEYGEIGGQTTNETPRYGVIGTGSELNSDSGGLTTTPADMFNGYIGTFRYFNETLTADEVATLYSNFIESNYTNPPPVVGDFYGGGVVFYIFEDGDAGYVAGETHGLIAAVSDQSSGIRWYNGINLNTGATATAVGTGITNTMTIINAQGATETSYAAGLVRAYTGGGYTDWYLPSKDELNKMYLNRTTINTTATSNSGSNFANNNYWSSTEAANVNAWLQNFSSNTYQSDGNKSWAIPVRAVRAF
jgi:hypothetical protein